MTVTDNKPVQHVIKYGPLQCPYFFCGKTFIPKKFFGNISLEEQAKCEQSYIDHCDSHYHKAMQEVTTLPYQRIK